MIMVLGGSNVMHNSTLCNCLLAAGKYADKKNSELLSCGFEEVCIGVTSNF